MAGLGWSRGQRIRLLAPSWMDQIFGTGAVGDLVIGDGLINDLIKAMDAEPLTRGCGLQIGVAGRAKHGEQPLRASRVIRGPTMNVNTSLVIYIGPELSRPPIAPSVSRTHKVIAELFSTGITCSLAVFGWIGAIGSAVAIPASGGAAAFATVYFSNAAALATVQCVGGTVHTSLVLSDKDAKAEDMDKNLGWQNIDRFADFFNLAAVVYVGRDLVLLKRGLQAAGVTLTDAAAAEINKGGAITLAKLMKLMEDVKDPEAVAREVRTRIYNAVLLGLGVYGSSRDAAGGYNQIKSLVLGEAPPEGPQPPTPIGTPIQPSPAMGAVSGDPAGFVAAPPIFGQMLGYRPEQGEVATIAFGLLRTR